jgi:23S rRNA (cytidine2498-2'-O)-methyltransferase
VKEFFSDFIFTLDNGGAERALKLEVELMKLPWRFSYQKKGFVAFKADPEGGPFSFTSLLAPVAFARRICLSIGKAACREDAERLVMDALATHPAGRGFLVHHARYHDHKMQGIPAYPGKLAERPHLGQCIGTVVELGSQEFFAGLHLHSQYISPDPAGDSGIIMPEKSPSRAWLKLEEAVRFFDISLTKKDIVVEVGCAPGGVALALLDRGVPVIGVDPATMADVVLAYAIDDRYKVPAGKPWFYHCRKPAARVGKKDLGNGVTWFMSDMNESPEVIIKECIRFVGMAPDIRGALMTLKLTDLSEVVEKEKWFATLRSAGFITMRLQSLSVNHRELALLALR